MKKVRLVVLALVLAAMVGTACLCIFAADAPSVKVMSANLSLQDNVYMYFSVAYDNVDTDKDTCGVIFWTAEQEDYTLEAAAGNAAAKIVAKPNSWRQDERLGKKLGVFTYGVSAKEMTDTLYVQAYAQVNGQTVYGTVISYSPVIYAERKLGLVEGVAGTTDEKLKDLLVQMLRYGAAAQVYFDYHTDYLATDVIGTPGLHYTDNGSGWSVSKGTMTDTNVIIPKRHLGMMVTEIADGAFNGCARMEKIQIPESIASVGNSAFGGCTELQYTLSGGGQYLGNDENPYLVLVKSDDIASVQISEGCRIIGASAFFNLKNLTSVSIPDSVLYIGSSNFLYCDALSYYQYNNGCYLGNSNNQYLFLRDVANKNITSFVIHAQTKFIHNLAFNGCKSIKNFTVSEANKVYHCDRNCIIETASGALIVGSNTSVIPSYVTSIGDYAFIGRTELTDVVIPDGVTNIGESAFSGCTGLTSATIGNSVTSIGRSAFSGCTGLTSITIPDSVTSIGDSAFRGCKGLTSVNIGSSVTSIESYAFGNCSELTSVIIPSSVTSISSSSFDGCKWLHYNVYDNALYLGNTANPYFVLIKAKNTEITVCEIHPDTKIIGGAAFGSCKGLSHITIPDSVTNIGNSAFYGCTTLTSIIISQSVTGIGGSTFSGCVQLRYISIPNSVTNIDGNAFSGCTRLTSITIPDSVTSIGNLAFSGCTSLTSVTFANASAMWKVGGYTVSVADPAQNAKYLNDTYQYYTWTRKN